MTRALTAAQVYYVVKVYPETISDAEAREVYEQEVTAEEDRSYWEATARVLSQLCL